MHRKYILWGVCLLIGAVLVIVVWRTQHPKQVLYAVFKSPDAAYRLEVYSTSDDIAFPGQGGDVAGEVFLKDREGRTLETTKVEMVQLVRDPQWSSNRVKVHLIFDWTIK